MALLKFSNCFIPIPSSPLQFSAHVSANFSLFFSPKKIKLLPSVSLSPSSPILHFQSFAEPRTKISATMATGYDEEVLPPVLTSASEPPPLFDGTTRLYISYSCPYAQRAWIARNCKGLQNKIQLVPIDLQDRPAWYKDMVYPANKVPSLEHSKEVKGESLDLIKYIDEHFEGPSLFPNDPEKRAFGEELLSYTDSFNRSVIFSIKGDANEADSAFEYIESALSKFDDGSFFLGQFSLVDIAYAPFVEKYQPFLLEVKNYDITAGRPNLVAWIEEMNKNDGYKQTKRDPKELVDVLKSRFLAQN